MLSPSMPVCIGLFRLKIKKIEEKKEKFISGTKEIVLCHLKVGIPCASELCKCVGV